MISRKNVPMNLCLTNSHKATTAITKNLNKNYKLKIHVLLAKNILKTRFIDVRWLSKELLILKKNRKIQLNFFIYHQFFIE